MINKSFFMAHGAGVGHNSDFLVAFENSFKKSMDLFYVPVTFNYMKIIEKSGQRRPPPNFQKMVLEFSDFLLSYGNHKENDFNNHIVAGKSMGGRLATQLTHLPFVAGVVCFGFPFHQQGKPEKNRLPFLDALEKPCLIFQGTRDAFGKPDWVNNQILPEHVTLHWIEGADHDFSLLKSQNKSKQQIIDEMLVITDDWLKKHKLK